MSDLTLKKLREVNVARSNQWHLGGIDSWSASDWATALTGELGEACNIIKKLNRIRDGIKGTSISEVVTLTNELYDELADVLLYLDLLAARLNIDLEEAVRSKFNHVSDKHSFPQKL